MAKVNWDKLEVEYITNKISYSKLAKKYDISKSAVEKYGIKNNWVQKRRQYCGKVVAESLARAGTRDVEKLLKVQKSAEKMTKVIEDVFLDDKQFRRQIVTTTDKDGNLQQKEKLMKKYDTKAIRDMTGSLRELTSTIRDLFELYPESKRQQMEHREQKMDIEAEKLRLMKEKVYPADNNPEEFGIIEIAEVVEETEGGQSNE